MINVNPADNTAINTTNRATCAILWCKGKAYTNAAGLIRLEAGILAPRNLHAVLGMGRKRANQPMLDLLIPIDVNGVWFYSVAGWEKYRVTLIERNMV